MFNLYFGDLFSILSTLAVLVLTALIVYALANRQRIAHWGRLVAVFILLGTALSGLAAMRDRYMSAGALFTADSLQSTICSIAGGLIFLTGLVCLLRRRQPVRKAGFYFVSVLFAVQVLTVELTRVLVLM